MSSVKLRSMQPDEWQQVADLICNSTNRWYEVHGRPPIFPAGASSTLLFCEVYEALDPGCCIVAEDEDSGRLVGSCFYHPRETHVSLGIMNVHPDWFGRRIAVQMLDQVIGLAEENDLPVRLVSSAMNLDSFSLYTRAGFVPRFAFQDMFIRVPNGGMRIDSSDLKFVRDAKTSDVSAMADLELSIAGISREKDYRFFVDNAGGYWHTSVFDEGKGAEGFLVSISHPGSNMLGPGVARTTRAATALLLAELNFRRGTMPVFLLPVNRSELVATAYEWGARNCEIHFGQVRGDYTPIDGVVMPTFMPETG